MTEVVHEVHERRQARWSLTAAHVRAIVAGLAGAVGAVVVHRPDLLVVASPLLVIAVWSVVLRPVEPPALRTRLGRSVLREGEATRLHYELGPVRGVHQVSAVLRERPFIDVIPSSHAQTSPVSSAEQQGGLRLTFAVRSVRWGEQSAGPGLLALDSVWGAYRWGPAPVPEATMLTLPVAPVFDAHAPTPHPIGLVGLHRSSRPGDGSEFNTIRPFQVGDRLRHIHWRSSLRDGHLNVTSTFADHDSQVLVIVDATNDLGTSGGVDGASSTLDLTVRAAAAVAEDYVRRGDRVGLRVEGSARRTTTRVAGGRAHLRRLLGDLARIQAGGGFRKDDEEVITRLRIEPGTLVVLLSPLVSSSTLRRALALGRRGFTLIVVDTMPERLDLGEGEPHVPLAWRIRMLERRVEMDHVLAAGIPIVAWRGPGSLDQILRDLGRRASRPKLVRR